MSSKRILRIGTRDSKLAMWQATTVASLLNKAGVATELVPVKSEGDLDLVTPLYAMGVEGVFTKTLDAFLLSDRIDVAVHSFKDVPTRLAVGISQAAVLPRASADDLLVFKEEKFAEAFLKGDDPTLKGIVATGSVRRKAQILGQFPLMQIENLRGNVQTRMRKLLEGDWDGAIFAAAGLERIEQRPDNARAIPWMLPAPAQGAIVVVARENDEQALAVTAGLNDPATATTVQVEREFLSTLMGGCSTPISAHASIAHQELLFKGCILSLDGTKKFACQKRVPLTDVDGLGVREAKALMEQGADRIVAEIRAGSA